MPHKNHLVDATHSQSKPWVSILCLIALVFASIAITSFGLYLHDAHRLRQVSKTITSHLTTPSEKVAYLTQWVHHNGGTSINTSYFLLRRWRATPLQVLEHGGDCADKSRLLAAMLDEIGIDATLALCFNKATNAPAHTLVEAQIENEGYMVTDPAFNLLFPRENGPGYYGITELRQSPDIVDKRIAQLRASNSSRSELDEFYLRSSSSYDTASTFNWNKNALTQSIEASLLSRLGEASYRIPRPRFLEEPTLLAASSSLIMALISLMAAYIGTRVRRSRLLSAIVNQGQSTVEHHTLPGTTPFFGTAS